MVSFFHVVRFFSFGFALLWPLSVCAQTPKRVVSVAPSTTEILFALGLDAEVVGVSRQCDYPPRARTKTNVGDFSQPNMETIVALKPDVVFCTGIEQAPAAEKLRQRGLTVFVSDPESFQELFDSIEHIGRLMRKDKEAAALIAGMKKDMEQVAQDVAAVPEDKRPKVFFEIWHTPLMTAGKGTFLDELIRLAGGINVAADMGKRYGNISPEQVIRRDPDCVFLTYMDGKSSVQAVKTRWGWSAMSAVVHDRVYNDLDPSLFLTPGPRLTQGLKEIHRRLYP